MKKASVIRQDIFQTSSRSQKQANLCYLHGPKQGITASRINRERWQSKSAAGPAPGLLPGLLLDAEDQIAVMLARRAGRDISSSHGQRFHC
ncbi:hypothetical protein Q9966_010051 [Columba livia]|nr:hypothetical protein Q9966_010051 [Columba livia]